MHGRYAHAHFDDLDLFRFALSQQLSITIRIKLAATVGYDKFYFKPSSSIMVTGESPVIHMYAIWSFTVHAFQAHFQRREERLK